MNYIHRFEKTMNCNYTLPPKCFSVKNIQIYNYLYVKFIKLSQLVNKIKKSKSP